MKWRFLQDLILVESSGYLILKLPLNFDPGILTSEQSVSVPGEAWKCGLHLIRKAHLRVTIYSKEPFVIMIVELFPCSKMVLWEGRLFVYSRGPGLLGRARKAR